MAVFTLLCVYILYLNDLLLFWNCQPYNQCFNKIIMHTYLSLLYLPILSPEQSRLPVLCVWVYFQRKHMQNSICMFYINIH